MGIREHVAGGEKGMNHKPWLFNRTMMKIFCVSYCMLFFLAFLYMGAGEYGHAVIISLFGCIYLCAHVVMFIFNRKKMIVWMAKNV